MKNEKLKSNSETLYFDLIGGISGDMVVGALLDLGVSFTFLKSELKKLKLSGYVLKKHRVQRGHIKATKFDCPIKQNKNYSYRQIIRLINASALSMSVRDKILNIFKVLAEAEDKIHGHDHRDIRFEQLGDMDTLIDVAAVCICLDKLQAIEILYSFVPLNQHTAPATLELLRNKKIHFTGSIFENVTPTGAAILCALGRQIDPTGDGIFTTGQYGYGAGFFNPESHSNVLRAVELKKEDLALESDELLVLETNIDDMNPQFFEHIFDKLFKAGAVDVFIENCVMKKSRPGFLLKVLLTSENLGKISVLVLEETTTSGVRFYPVKRIKTKRAIKTLSFNGHTVRVKIMPLPQGGVKVAPEYDDVRALALENKQPLCKIYDSIKRKAELKWHSLV